MRKFRIVLLVISITLLTMPASAIDGAWRGELTFGQVKLPLVFNFSRSPFSNNVSCTIDSPSQGAKGIETAVLFSSPDSVAVASPMIGATFTARITGNVIKGTFSQRGMSFPLTLIPDEDLSVRRPQTPLPPFPYTVIDTVFSSPDGTQLAATLTLPERITDEPAPAIVMVTGSGPQNRDEEVFEHKPFAVIADFLARRGIASLRYDDRGYGHSSGDYTTATINDFTNDARSALDFLRSVVGISPVGVLGHSEGGTIALKLGSERKADFVVSLAGMAVSGKQTILDQNARGLDIAGISGTSKENSLAIISRFFDMVIAQENVSGSRPIDVDSLVATLDLEIPAEVITALKSSQRTMTPEVRSLLSIEPSTYLHSVTCPVLAVNGDKDTQVDADSNIALINKTIPHAETRIFPGLNHLFQNCRTGSVDEYGEIRETISPEALEVIATFIESLK